MTATISNLMEFGVGNKRMVRFDVDLGTYAVNGISVTPAMLGLSTIDFVIIAPSGGVEYTYNYSTQKVYALRSAGYTQGAGSIVAPITTAMGNVTVRGGSTTGAALWLSTDTVTGALVKEAGGPRAIPPTTMGFPLPTATIAPVFTGTAATQVVIPQATGDLAAYDGRGVAFGT